MTQRSSNGKCPSGRLNCWQVMDCGLEQGGKKVAEFGACPAATDTSFDGINSGQNAGRVCWAVAGTYCGGCLQGSFAEKRPSCRNCAFYQMVQEQERHAGSRIKFLQFVNREHRSPFFDEMTCRHVKAGERFVMQGAVEDKAYIIQHGSCLVIVEKEGQLHPVDHYGEGDIVGGLGILTGEPRRAHVEAETDMLLWEMTREQFDDFADNDPDLLAFITELVADRLDSRRPTAYRTIGKYIATDIIGRGAFSIVYKGVHKDLNMPVTIKMMRHHMALQPDFFQSFYDEAKIIAGLSHPHIVKVYDFEERHRTLFIIMEYLRGDSLKQMIAHLRAIAPYPAARYLYQLCDALAYAHERGIIHRDINPANILVQPNDQVKVLDFGLACAAGTEDFSNPGTAHYVSPEQIRGDPVDARADIYALGVTAYEMLSGRRPFEAKEARTLIDLHLRRDVADPGLVKADIPPLLRAFVQRCGRRDPAQRYQTMHQARAALRSLLGNTDLGLARAADKRRAALCLAFKDEHGKALNALIQTFKAKAGAMGVEVELTENIDMRAGEM